MYFEIVGPIANIERIAAGTSTPQLSRLRRRYGRGYARVIDESGEDYLYPSRFFVAVEVPHKAKRAWPPARRSAKRQSSSNKPLQRSGGRVARSGRCAPERWAS